MTAKLIYDGRPEQGLVPYFTPECYDEHVTDKDYCIHQLYVRDLDGFVMLWDEGTDKEELLRLAPAGSDHWVVKKSYD